MNFKFSKGQSVRAAKRINDDVKAGTRGTVKGHRADPDMNRYLVSFRGVEHWQACDESELEKVR